jgi:stringent starvation protein B
MPDVSGKAAMTSTRPYLLRAIYEWIVDNSFTPHLLVEVGDPRVRVPSAYVDNGVIVLNAGPGAVRDLDLGNEYVTFSARFGGTPHSIVVPLESVQAIYARENGQGMLLGGDDATRAPLSVAHDGGNAEVVLPTEEKPGQRAPTLTIVK